MTIHKIVIFTCLHGRIRKFRDQMVVKFTRNLLSILIEGKRGGGAIESAHRKMSLTNFGPQLIGRQQSVTLFLLARCHEHCVPRPIKCQIIV